MDTNIQKLSLEGLLISLDTTDTVTCNEAASKITTDISQSYSFPQVVRHLDTRHKDTPKKIFKYLTDILQNINANKQWLWPTACDFSDYERTFVRLTQSIYKHGCVGAFPGREDIGFNSDDFPEVTTKASVCLKLFALIFQHLSASLVKKEDEFCQSAYRKSLKALTVKSFLLCAEHYHRDSLWVTDESHNLAQTTLKELLMSNTVDTIDKFLCSQDPSNAGYFTQIYSEIQPRLTAQCWKQNPAIKVVFFVCLSHISSPHCSEHLDRLLPPSLLFADDHQLDNKVLGVRCLQHIINNTSTSELTWYGRADVIFALLQQLLYSHDPLLLSVLLPCLHSILCVYDKNVRKHESKIKESYKDEILRRILTDMQLEDKLAVRRVYVQHLPLFISSTNAFTQLPDILNVIKSYLEVYDGQKETARLGMLYVLEVVIKKAWPRIKYRLTDIMQCLLKLIYDVHAEDSLVDVKLRNQIEQSVEQCLQLLHKLCPDQVKNFWNPLGQIKTVNGCDEFISRTISSLQKD